jgi:hypothetical protein
MRSSGLLPALWFAAARFGSDDTTGARELMRRRGPQVDPSFYTGTFWEFVGSNGLPTRGFDSLTHARGAGPTQLLTSRSSARHPSTRDTPRGT